MPAPPLPPKTCEILLDEHKKLRETLLGWMDQQRKLHTAHLEQQEQLVTTMFGAYSGTLRELGLPVNDFVLEGETRSIKPSVWSSGSGKTPEPGPTPAPEKKDELEKEPEDPPVDQGVASEAKEVNTSEPLDLQALSKLAKSQVSAYDEDRALVDCWVHCSGLHTVEKWVKNYRKHPAGWAALLTIHGVPEVTGRLRSKVENYAIYSALFLSVSIGLLSSPDGLISDECLDTWSSTWWECQIRRRLYFYLLAFGTACHMLSIMLGMGFNNALNEAARDSDVFRMFSRGKGFMATVKCERAFSYGCLADFAAMVVSMQGFMGWDAVPLAAVLFAGCAYVYRTVVGLLFKSASIVKYWREELGGVPDKDDPYDLATPMSGFDELAKTNQKLFVESGILSGSDAERQANVWAKMREAADDQGDEEGHRNLRNEHAHRSHLHQSAVASLF